jgi:hypothetical protein
MYKIFFILISSLLIMHSNAHALTAAEIMKLSDDRYTGDTQKSESTLTLIDKKDRERVRDLKLFGIDKDDIEKSLIFFESPSDVAGTAYMSFDWEDVSKEDDSWLYLPALQSVKRVASSEESGAFMGSDFSYTDINGQDYEDFNYEMLKESEIIDGIDTWVIKSIPKNDKVIKKTGYLESTSWVRKSDYIVMRSVIQVKKRKLVKYFSASDIQEIQGIMTPMRLQMITTRNGKKQHSSVFKITKVRYNEDVSEALFDTQAMQRGL